MNPKNIILTLFVLIFCTAFHVNNSYGMPIQYHFSATITGAFNNTWDEMPNYLGKVFQCDFFYDTSSTNVIDNGAHWYDSHTDKPSGIVLSTDGYTSEGTGYWISGNGFNYRVENGNFFGLNPLLDSAIQFNFTKGMILYGYDGSHAIDSFFFNIDSIVDPPLHTPEPTSFLLFAMGLIGIVGYGYWPYSKHN